MLTLALLTSARAEVVPVLMETGRFQVSVDGAGSSTTDAMTYEITRPSANATVFAAFAAVTSSFLTGDPGRNSLVIGGIGVSLDERLDDSTSSVITRFDDVTAELSAFLEALPAGTSLLQVTEDGNPIDNEGNLLFVVWEDPAFDRAAVALSLGSEITLPATTAARLLTEPIDPTVPGFRVEMGLGIAFSAGDASGQVSVVDVNGTEIADLAGGADDGDVANGGLFTIGGDGDRRAEEHYDLTALMNAGDTEMLTGLSGATIDDFVVAAWTFAPGVRFPCSPSDPGATGFPEDWFVDQDGDGFGQGAAVVTCDGPPGANFVDSGADCDDADPALQPGNCLSIETGPVGAGQNLDVRVSGAQPGETVTVLISAGAGAGSCPAPLNGVCLDLNNPQRFDSAIADASGVAVMSRLIPPQVPAQTVRFVEAVVARPGLTSETSPALRIVVP